MRANIEQSEKKIIHSSDELHYLVALNASESFKRHFRILYKHFKSMAAIYNATEKDLKGVPGLATQSVTALLKVKKQYKPGLGLERLQGKNISLITYWDEKYPVKLKEVINPPPLLYVNGDLTYNYDLSIGIVGTRRASRYGLEQAFKLGKELAQLGFTIISGGASGIDSQAHKGVLDAGGNTFAVFGAGIDVVFPASNTGLFRQIASKGALVSEFAPGTPPEPYRFPIRNRIIAGMSKGTLVIQAPVRSGALITSEYALETGREVLALPGKIDDPMSAGANQLIHDGAHMVLSIDDILTAFKVVVQKRKTDIKLPALDKKRNEIVEKIGWEPMHIDDISHELKIPVATLSGMILELQLDGYLKELTGKRYVRLAP